MRFIFLTAAPALALALFAAFDASSQTTAPQLPPGTPHPFLSAQEWPDSLALLAPPPAPGSAAMASDEAARTSALPLRNSARWSRAASDADLAPPHALQAFSCATNATISPQDTPHLYELLTRAMIDIGLSTYRAKNRYQRIRPFVAHNEATCFPRDEAALRTDGSYPSGHSAVGWGWALILAEVAPERTDAILARGRDFGQSRVICDAHWQSDVDAGRVIAAATVARLHANAAFQTALTAAKTEITSSTQRPDAATCAAETASLTADR